MVRRVNNPYADLLRTDLFQAAFTTIAYPVTTIAGYGSYVERKRINCRNCGAPPERGNGCSYCGSYGSTYE